MRHSIVFIVSVFGAAFLSQNIINAYPNGAPEEACDSMRPGHHTLITDNNSALIEPQTGKSFYGIHFDKTKFNPGEEIMVTLHAHDSDFEGFLLEARHASEQISDGRAVDKYGTFRSHDNQTQLLCNNQAITHAVHEHFTSITVTWIAPNVALENIQFVATVVKGYEIIFMNVHSETLNFSAAVSLVPSFVLMSCMCFFTLRHMSL